MMSRSAAAVTASPAAPCGSSTRTSGVDAQDANASDARDGAAQASHHTSVGHCRQRRSWTEEEKRAFWKQKKLEKRERRKAAAADRLKAQQAEWVCLTEEEKEARRAEAVLLHERRRHAEAALVTRCEAQLADSHVPAIVFDLSFAWCMTVANTKSTVSQVMLSYSALRTAGFPFRPVITSLMGKEASDAEHDATGQAEVLQALNNYEGFRRFPPRVTQMQHWSELFAPSQVVFLTADSPDTLTSIEPDTAYIVGAFVDHNAHKGLSYASAQRHGVRTARLPIKESVVLGNRCKVLTINHLVEVLIQYEKLRATGTPDWAQAINSALPTRRTQQVISRRRKRGQMSVTGSDDKEGDDDEVSDDGCSNGESDNADGSAAVEECQCERVE
ncbi:conserved hypothetical protein [Leishmania mexicana MHOM/GT/2001/U1103]|uniref:tRNA (guanine(9)-N(1))-methyltransferase n=1 Tax=Leishmania mexicana (strain MHOM/GT/2001/U1103) TaxID=929439 RepID=E9B181_LEIMU|nr:conserved hypothetical protein [Leishmania mexicana MHOM/GT/2001/U1103]CBZ28987.1 conserved hypothetical protein [Leishmania mexicana MHOM/GT/2001/U1103]